MNQSLKHIALLAAILLLTGLIYSKLPTAYFCAYDDFLEVHRAAFEDTHEPSRVWTTTHFDSYKYRPLNRGINLLTYWAGDGDATYFRTRNVLCHLLNIVLIYLLAWLLFRGIVISGTAAFLFGLHPLANQAVAGAVMTNTAAHSMFLIAILAFLFSIRRTRLQFIWLVLPLFAGWLSLLTYEAAVVAYPLMFAYLVIRFLATRKWPVTRAYTVALSLGSLFFFGVYYLIHARYVPYTATRAIPSVTVMLRSSAMYAGALLSPIDFVLANAWFGVPLPSEISFSTMAKILWVVPIVLAVLVGLIWYLLKRLKVQVVDRQWPEELFVAVAALSVLLPLILFTDKASETYMYLAVGFGAVLFASILRRLLNPSETVRGRIVFVVLVAMLSVSFACATFVRNSLVARCGTTASRIVTTMQRDKLRNGPWFIWLAPVPGEPQSHRYGMYGWRGVDTVGVTAVEAAAQLANGNKMLAATVLSPEALRNRCAGSRDVCFAVHADGKTDEINSTVANGR